jgi:hypothetical protein
MKIILLIAIIIFSMFLIKEPTERFIKISERFNNSKPIKIYNKDKEIDNKMYETIINKNLPQKNMLNLNNLKEIPNNFRYRFSQVTNHLINTGDLLKLESTRKYINRLYFNDKIYFIERLEWTKPSFSHSDLEFHVVTKDDKSNHYIRFILPLQLNKNVNFMHSQGIDTFIMSTDHIPQHKRGVWSKGNIITANLSNLCPLYQQKTLKYLKIHKNTDWFITKPQKINRIIGLNILKKLNENVK